MAALIIPTFHGLTYAAAAAAPSTTTTTSLRRVDVTPRTRTRSAVIKIIQARSSSSAGRGIADPLVTSHARDVFREEKDKINRYCNRIVPDADIWDLDVELSRYLCLMATKSVRLASFVMELVVIRPDKPDVEPISSTKEFLERTVLTFVNITEDVYHEKVTKRTIASFVSAVDGVATMSYFAALVTLWDLRMYSGPDSDVERAWREHKTEMDKLRHVFDMADPLDAKKMVKATVTDAIALVRSFVTLMIAYRKDVLLACAAGATTKVPDDGEPADKCEKSPAEKSD